VDVSLRGVPRLRALAVIKGQVSDDPPGMAATLQQLCRGVTRDLELAGATVTLIPEVGRHAVAAVSTDQMTHTEELQFDAGEGPTRDAYRGGAPVVVTDEESLVRRWPGYAPAAIADGVSAVFSLPLQVGAARLGALTLYWRSPESPARGDLRSALVFADLATDLLIDHSYSTASGGFDPQLVSALETHGHVYQAQGMVMVDLGVGLPEALARMRAQAYASGQHLAVLASGIIDGSAVVARDLNHNQ
jgi:hypothetical protein